MRVTWNGTEDELVVYLLDEMTQLGYDVDYDLIATMIAFLPWQRHMREVEDNVIHAIPAYLSGRRMETVAVNRELL